MPREADALAVRSYVAKASMLTKTNGPSSQSIGYKDKEFRSKTVSSKNAPKLLARYVPVFLLDRARLSCGN